MTRSFAINGRRSFCRLPPPGLLMGILASMLPSLTAPTAAAAQTQPVLTWGGEIRPRFFAREPVGDGWDQWISMRSRIALDARVQPGLGLFFQVQDVRFWGEELSNRDRRADAVDFHQAYLEVDSLPGIGGMVRAGRQEVSLGEGRFIASPDWGQAGQSFDGARWIRPLGDARLDLVYLRIREGSAPFHDSSADFTAAELSLPIRGQGRLSFLAIHDRSEDPDGTGQSTVGSTWQQNAGPFSLRVQGMYQSGERRGSDVNAYMFAARGTLKVLGEKGSVTLWYDYLSGDSDAGDAETKAFSNLFGARHRFYGRADYFLDIPEDTGGLGLRDAAVKFSFAPTQLLTMNLDLHDFTTAQEGTISCRRLARETDLWIRYRFREALVLEAGYSLTWAGRAMERLGRLEGTGNMGYVMTSLRF